MSAPSKTADEYYQMFFDDPTDTSAVGRLHQLAKEAEQVKRGEIPYEWRLLLRDTREDVEVLTRVRDTLLKKLRDQEAEFSAKEAELKQLREVGKVVRECLDAGLFAHDGDGPDVFARLRTSLWGL